MHLSFISFLGERLSSDYAAKTSLKYLVKQLRNDLNDVREKVRTSLESITSVLKDKKRPDQQLMEGETKLPEDSSSERLGK